MPGLERDIAQLAHDWARDPILWEPRLSKDGRWVAWTWTGPTEAGNVWLAPTDGSAAPRRVTDEAMARVRALLEQAKAAAA